MLFVAFISGVLLSALVGVVIYQLTKKRYVKLAGEMENEIGDWNRVDLPPDSRADEKGEFSHLYESVYNLMDKTRALVQEIDLTSQQVRAASDKMDTTVKSVSDVATTFEQLQNVADSVNQTGATLEQDFTSSESAIEESSSVIERVNETVGELTGSHNTLNEQTKKLETAVDQVTSIAENISQISEQTKMLALNAAIEAARAGEHGKGFSVVAEEIGKLSDSTSSAVKQAFTVLETMKSDVNSVVSSITGSLSSSTNAAEELNSVQETLSDSLKLIQKVNNTAKETFYDVNNNLQEIASALESRNYDIKHIVNTGKLLAALADNLEQVTQQNQLTYEIKNEVTSRIEAVKELLNQVSNQDSIITMDSAEHESILSRVKREHHYIEAIWSNDSVGNFLFSEPEAGLADARVREWWQKAMVGEIFVSPIYVSAITRQPCLTVSVPIMQGNTIIGIIGADVGLG